MHQLFLPWALVWKAAANQPYLLCTQFLRAILPVTLASLAVEDLDLKISTGSLFGLIGPNAPEKQPPCACWLDCLSLLLEIRINELPIRKYWLKSGGKSVYARLLCVYETLVWNTWTSSHVVINSPRNVADEADELLELVDLTEKRDAYVHAITQHAPELCWRTPRFMTHRSCFWMTKPLDLIHARAPRCGAKLRAAAMGKTVSLARISSPNWPSYAIPSPSLSEENW
jgi:hypothetical protein